MKELLFIPSPVITVNHNEKGEGNACSMKIVTHQASYQIFWSSKAYHWLCKMVQCSHWLQAILSELILANHWSKEIWKCGLHIPPSFYLHIILNFRVILYLFGLILGSFNNHRKNLQHTKGIFHKTEIVD